MQALDREQAKVATLVEQQGAGTTSLRDLQSKLKLADARTERQVERITELERLMHGIEAAQQALVDERNALQDSLAAVQAGGQQVSLACLPASPNLTQVLDTVMPVSMTDSTTM